MGQTVTLRFDPAAPPSRSIEVWHEHNFIARATPLDAYAKRFVRRNRPSPPRARWRATPRLRHRGPPPWRCGPCSPLSLALAKKFSFPISIEFRWQQKENAAFPGKLGRMDWGSV